VNGPSLLALFDQLTVDVQVALGGLDDWGLSGEKETQYRHDVVADDIVVAPLLDAGLRVLTEESGLVAANPDAAVTVVVDPIDGSTNASHGLPWYATSFCAIDDDGPLAASVTNLASGERFEAIRSEGATSSHRTVVGPTRPSGVTDVSDALLSFSGLPPAHGGWRQFRAYGAAALDMCSVATGSFDGFVDVDGAHGVWDYAGAALICVEAGAAVGDALDRDLITFDSDQRRAPIVAATPELFRDLIAMWRGWQVATA
jgi:fructose-1,6-bisphosphatase/inositol monophosphatase family enzyme